MTIYNIGAGIADITDPAIGTNMQGMADPSQIVEGVQSKLYARTFVVEDQSTGTCVAVVTADIWAGTNKIKSAVLSKLQDSFQDKFSAANLLVAGTHTHSGPGGFSSSSLYEQTGGGTDDHTTQCIVSGIVTSIESALKNLSPGKIYINKGDVADCGRQRSLPAYQQNPAQEQQKYQHDTDKEMLLLKFVVLDGGNELPIGVLSWYAIHPTDLGQTNRLISGDNKGFAAALFEEEQGTDYDAQETFVAAFANSNCGDVSGNVEFGHIPNGTDDVSHMELHGQKQFEVAKTLFDTATEELDGPIDFRYAQVDMSQVELEDGSGNRTWPAGLGLSFAAGSTEDSVPRIKVGIQTMDSFKLPEGLQDGGLTPEEEFKKAAIIAGLALTFGITSNSSDFIAGHDPKPLILAPGLIDPSVVPQVLPIQLVQIGGLAIAGIPGELTTMAGRRLRESTLLALQGTGVFHLALGTYANEYSQYITTKEEYVAQHYEGASTLFGPHTLEAYQQEFARLADTLKTNSPAIFVPNFDSGSAEGIGRITFRNLSSNPATIELYEQTDSFSVVMLEKLTVPGMSDFKYVIPKSTNQIKAKLPNEEMLEHISTGEMVIINPQGGATLADYRPPVAPVQNRSTIRPAVANRIH